MKHLIRIGKVLQVILGLVMTIVLAVLCYFIMFGMDMFLELVRSWYTDNGFVNFLIYVFQFIVSGFKYSLTLVAAYFVFKIFMNRFSMAYGFRRKYIFFLAILFGLFSIILLIIGPDYKLMFDLSFIDETLPLNEKINVYFTEAFSNSMLINYFRSFDKFLGVKDFRQNIIILQDILVTTLYYMGAFIKPIKMMILKYKDTKMLLAPLFYSIVFVIAGIFVTATNKDFNPFWCIFLYLSPLVILTVFNYVLLFKNEEFYSNITFIFYAVEAIIFFVLSIILTFEHAGDGRFFLCLAISLIVPEIPFIFLRVEFSSIIIIITAIIISACLEIGLFINTFWVIYLIPVALILGLIFVSCFNASKNYELESHTIILGSIIMIFLSALTTGIIAIVMGYTSLFTIIPLVLLLGGIVPFIIHAKRHVI